MEIEKLQVLQDKLSEMINEIKTMFSEPVRVSIVVKNSNAPGRDVVIGDATRDDIISVLRLIYSTDTIVIEGTCKEGLEQNDN